MIQAELNFDGKTFNPSLDGGRLTSLYHKVFRLMEDGRWRTLSEIQAVTGGSEAGISARIRDTRKLRFDGHRVNRRRKGDPTRGLYEYNLHIAYGEKP